MRALRRGTRIAARQFPLVLADCEFAVYPQTQRRAARDGIDFHLTPEEFALLLCRAGGRCEETHLPFEDRKVVENRY